MTESLEHGVARNGAPPEGSRRHTPRGYGNDTSLTENKSQKNETCSSPSILGTKQDERSFRPRNSYQPEGPIGASIAKEPFRMRENHTANTESATGRTVSNRSTNLADGAHLASGTDGEQDRVEPLEAVRSYADPAFEDLMLRAQRVLDRDATLGTVQREAVEHNDVKGTENQSEDVSNGNNGSRVSSDTSEMDVDAYVEVRAPVRRSSSRVRRTASSSSLARARGGAGRSAGSRSQVPLRASRSRGELVIEDEGRKEAVSMKVGEVKRRRVHPREGLVDREMMDGEDANEESSGGGSGSASDVAPQIDQHPIVPVTEPVGNPSSRLRRTHSIIDSNSRSRRNVEPYERSTLTRTHTLNSRTAAATSAIPVSSTAIESAIESNIPTLPLDPPQRPSTRRAIASSKSNPTLNSRTSTTSTTSSRTAATSTTATRSLRTSASITSFTSTRPITRRTGTTSSATTARKTPDPFDFDHALEEELFRVHTRKEAVGKGRTRYASSSRKGGGNSEDFT
ncbi:hypothetical protein HK097_006378 [Rhizophlyctis rosea]|uniref:Uncharacterized protein n=1 Tax=Rhizophlyctis rosea TaxID=64517 RepID=A0AAD5X9I3_9FUNG|nr:hypothetical protein HK097_006378 [Rhizophlyctis rosea]